MNMRITFNTELRMALEKEAAGAKQAEYRLLTPFYVGIEVDDAYYELVIPEGFKTDLCSVPKMPFTYLLFGGIGQKAGVAHDALYSAWSEIKLRKQSCWCKLTPERDFADKVLFAALRACGVGRVQAWAMYQAVSLFGGAFWKKDKWVTQ